jgi:hypothetical protein
MDINIQDEHYKKYIKYKTKYLELKEQSGGGGVITFFKSEEEKIYGEKIDIKKTLNIFKTHNTSLWDIEKYLTNIIFQELYKKYFDNNEEQKKNIIIELYKIICNTINNYYEYFKNKDISKKHTIEENNKNNLTQLIKHLDNIKTPLLKQIVELYFTMLNNHIKKDFKDIPVIIYNTCKYNKDYVDDVVNNRHGLEKLPVPYIELVNKVDMSGVIKEL